MNNCKQHLPEHQGNHVALVALDLVADGPEIGSPSLFVNVARSLFPRRRKRKLKPRVDTDLFTAEEAAAYLRVTPKTVSGYVNDGKLRAINIGRGTKRPTYRFARADLDTFTKQQEARPCPPLMSSARTTRRSGTQSFGSEVIDIADRLRSGASAKRKR